MKISISNSAVMGLFLVLSTQSVWAEKAQDSVPAKQMMHCDQMKKMDMTKMSHDPAMKAMMDHCAKQCADHHSKSKVSMKCMDSMKDMKNMDGMKNMDQGQMQSMPMDDSKMSIPTMTKP